MTEFKVEIDNTYANVVKFGTGKRTLVILPGISLQPIAGIGEAVEQAYSTFADDYTVYLVDRRILMPESHTTRDMAQDVYEMMKSLGVEEADVYGVSHGGMTAISLAAMHGDFVRKMVLCSSCIKADEKMRENCKDWYRYSESNDVVNLNRSFFQKVYSEDFLKNYSAALEEAEKCGSNEDCERFRILLRECAAFDESSSADKITCPVFVIWDVNDKIIGTEAGEELARMLNAKVHVYESFSHAVYDEAPDIKERIKEFLL